MTTTLTEAQVLDTVKEGLDWRSAERARLERIYLYLRDPDPTTMLDLDTRSRGPLRWLARDVSPTVQRLAEMSRVNMLRYVVDASAQDMFVDGFRAPKSEVEEPAWRAWQLNRMDARQIGIHRSVLSYGASYVTVLPGTPVPVIRGASPRKMTAVYGDDEDWPEYAVEERRHPKKGWKLYRVYDSQRCWWVEEDDAGKQRVDRYQLHEIGKCPVVRFVSSVDDDGRITGVVEPLIPLQDQINVTTFGLQVAQHYGAFRQRYIMGWTGDTEEETLKASAKKIWAFEDTDITVGEFGQTDLSGYINSREASLRHLATVSQTPVHELLGQMANLSAEALVAARNSHNSKVREEEVTLGESHEQVLELTGEIAGEMTDPQAYVRWRDTEARSLSQVADALGKLVVGLGVPPQELWERIPGVSQQEVERWKEAAKQADAIAQLNEILNKQSVVPPTPEPVPVGQ